jgi:hypothetical protein
VRTASGVEGVDDLDEALAGGLPGAEEWRIHFHVPVHHAGENTTQRELMETLEQLLGGTTPATKHLEVETYTWSVLPDDERPTDLADLIAGIAAELRWAKRELVPPARATR